MANAAGLFRVGVQGVVKNARHGVAGDHPGRGLTLGRVYALCLPNRSTYTYGQDALCTQMYGGGQRCRLTHRAITKKLTVSIYPQRYRPKDKRNGAGGHQVLYRDGLHVCTPIGASPRVWRGRIVCLYKCPVHAAGVAGRGDGKAGNQALADGAFNGLQFDGLVQRVHQRCVVQQGAVRTNLARQYPSCRQ